MANVVLIESCGAATGSDYRVSSSEVRQPVDLRLFPLSRVYAPFSIICVVLNKWVREHPQCFQHIIE